jgi:hypothetical protein
MPISSMNDSMKRPELHCMFGVACVYGTEQQCKSFQTSAIPRSYPSAHSI